MLIKPFIHRLLRLFTACSQFFCFTKVSRLPVFFIYRDYRMLVYRHLRLLFRVSLTH